MNRFYLIGWLLFSLQKIISLSAHYLGRTPYGDKVMEDPERFLPNAVIFEVGVLLAHALIFSVLEGLLAKRRLWIRAIYLILICIWLAFGQLDQEVVRWLGNHMTWSFLQTYFGLEGGGLWVRLIASDIGYFILSILLASLPIPLSLWMWLRLRHRHAKHPSWWFYVPAWMACAAMVSFPFYWNWSDKRWRRIRPAAIHLAAEAWYGMVGVDAPENPKRAEEDLLALSQTGRLDPGPLGESHLITPQQQRYPLWHESPGIYDSAAFKALPIADKPDILFLVYESLRGFRSSLHGDTTYPGAMPHLDSLLRGEALVFPFTYSNGFPSPEGGTSLHLGLWPHHRKSFISEYSHLHTRSWTEILRSFGYHAEIVYAYDPSFDNFTPWLRKWYDRYEYNPAHEHDGPVVTRVLQLYDTLSRSQPQILALWTFTTHPPFDPPKEAHVTPAADVEARYDQALGYSEVEIVRLINGLKARGRWDRTLMVIVGDHSTPLAWHLRHPDAVGETLSPSHQWTLLAFLGGWKGLTQRGIRRDPAQHVDVSPTILDLLNIKAWNHAVGQSLVQKKPLGARVLLSQRYEAGVAILPALRIEYRFKGSLGAHVWPIDSLSARSRLLAPELHPFPQSPDSMTLLQAHRWRDAMLAYHGVLEGDRLMPHDSSH